MSNQSLWTVIREQIWTPVANRWLFIWKITFWNKKSMKNSILFWRDVLWSQQWFVESLDPWRLTSVCPCVFVSGDLWNDLAHRDDGYKLVWSHFPSLGAILLLQPIRRTPGDTLNEHILRPDLTTKENGRHCFFVFILVRKLLGVLAAQCLYHI